MSPLTLLLARVLAVTIPLVGLAWWKRIYPHGPLAVLAVAPVLLSLGLVFSESLLPVLFATDGALAVLALVDLATIARRKDFAVQREVGRIASLKQSHPVTLTLTHYRNAERHVWVRDSAPFELAPEPDSFELNLEPRSRVALHYKLHAGRRGAFNLPFVHLKVRSRFGLWVRLLDYPVPSAVHVYPDMKQLAGYAVLARRDRLNLLGLRHSRRVGRDNEFERLRDYTPDDNYKHIEWRSTARRGKLTVKDFQQNQSQRLIFVVDCGRMMVNESAGLSLLDHAFNSVLMASYVALSRNDAVGLLCFSDELHGFVPPRGGLKQMNRLLHAAYDRFPRLVESRYDQAFLYLAAHCTKRTLLVLITNVIDEVNANQIQDHLAVAAGRHLPMAVLLRDHRIFESLEYEDRRPSLYRAAAAADLLAWRRQVLYDLGARGVLTLDVYPEDLTAPLINRYLEIKSRHLL